MVSIDTILYMHRPTHKELFNKLREAKKAVSNGDVLIINTDAVACDALELDYLIETELLDVLSHLLDEISPEAYAGKKPPEKSYEQKIKDLDLFAFRVDSSRFKCKVYLKFALSNGTLWLVSLHQHRKPKGV